MYTSDKSIEAEERALKALSFLEQLETWIRDYKPFKESLPPEYRFEADVFEAKIKGLYEMLANGDEGAEDVIGQAKKLSDLAPSKIQRMGIAKQLIKLRQEQKFSIKDLAARFNISTNTISAFFKSYDNAKPEEKRNIAKNSIYNIQENMENLHAHVLRAIARHELDGDINAKNLAEYRQLIQLASKQMQEFNNARKFERLAVTIEEILLRHCTKESQDLIIAEFQQLGLGGFIESTTVDNRNPRRIEASL